MQKSRAERLKGIFRDIDKKSEAEKARLVWWLASFCLCGIFCLWLLSTGSDLSRLSSGGVDLSTLPAFPQLDAINLDEALQKSGEALSDYSQTSNAAWQELGDGYIATQGVLAGEDFSTLKLAQVEDEDGTMLLKYDHYYKEVPVLGSGLILAANVESREVTEKKNHLKRGINIAVDPMIPAKDAAERAAQGMDAGYVLSSAKLAIAAQSDGCYLVWQTVFKAETGEEKNVLVGAQHGSIIPAEDQASNMAE